MVRWCGSVLQARVFLASTSALLGPVSRTERGVDTLSTGPWSTTGKLS